MFAIDALIPSPTPGLGKCSARGPESITALSVETGAGLDGVLRQGRRRSLVRLCAELGCGGVKIPDGHGQGGAGPAGAEGGLTLHFVAAKNAKWVSGGAIC